MSVSQARGTQRTCKARGSLATTELVRPLLSGAGTTSACTSLLSSFMFNLQNQSRPLLETHLVLKCGANYQRTTRQELVHTVRHYMTLPPGASGQAACHKHSLPGSQQLMSARWGHNSIIRCQLSLLSCSTPHQQHWTVDTHSGATRYAVRGAVVLPRPGLHH